MRLALLATMTGLAALATACTPAAQGGEQVASAPVVAAPAPTPTAAPTPAPAPAPAPVATTAAVDTAKGKSLFNDWSCGACHTLADAGASGSIGPSFDGNTRVTREFAIATITNGQGAMPAFGGQMTDAEIAVVTDYIVAVKK